MTETNRLESFLKERDVPFQTQHHARAFTALEIAESEHVPGKMLAKVVILTDTDRLLMAVIPAPEHVNLDKAKAVIGTDRLRLAEESEFLDEFPDCEVGAMPPFGNLYDVPVYVDKTLAEDETIVFNNGTHTDTMSLKYKDFEQLVQPHIADLIS
jgi:Ala-tRNA(Pro) deacylase